MIYFFFFIKIKLPFITSHSIIFQKCTFSVVTYELFRWANLEHLSINAIQ